MSISKKQQREIVNRVEKKIEYVLSILPKSFYKRWTNMGDVVLYPQSFVDDFVESAWNTKEIKEKFDGVDDLLVKQQKGAYSMYAVSCLQDIFIMWQDLSLEEQVSAIHLSDKDRTKINLCDIEEEFVNFLESFSSPQLKKEIQDSTMDMYNKGFISKERMENEMKLMNEEIKNE